MTAWASMTWQEVQAEGRRCPIAIVPIGCVETQGAYVPVGLEYHLAQRLADEVARRVEGVSLPCLPYGNSDAFRNFPGTIYIRPGILSQVYEDVLSSIVRAGYLTILCIVTHVPNQPLIEHAARAVRETTGACIVWINPGPIAASMLPELFEDPLAVRGHGAEPGVSLARYLYDIDVPEDAMPEPRSEQLAGLQVAGHVLHVDGVPVGYPLLWEELYPGTGGYGDPTQGSAEIGRQMFDRIVNAAVNIVAAMQSVELESDGHSEEFTKR